MMRQNNLASPDNFASTRIFSKVARASKTSVLCVLSTEFSSGCFTTLFFCVVFGISFCTVREEIFAEFNFAIQREKFANFAGI